MRRLDPDPLDTVTDDDLSDAYAWGPGPGRQVRAVMVAALNGAATVHGRSGGLGNPADVRLFALLRDLADVILVGAGTVRAEGYGGVRLSGEHAERRTRLGFTGPPPIAVVSTGSLTGHEAVFTDIGVPPFVVTTEDGARHLPSLPAELIVAGEHELDLPRAIEQLVERGLARISCEGGPRLFGSLLAAGVLDELCLTMSPTIVGGGPGLIGNTSPAPRTFTLHTLHRAGDHLFGRYLRSDRT